MLNTTSQLFCSMSSVWVCLMFPHVSFRLYIFGRNSTQARLVSYFILSGDAWFSLIPLLMMFNLITWLRCCLSARLLYYKAFLFFWVEVFWDSVYIFLFIILFIHSFIHLYSHGLMVFYFIWLIIVCNQYLFIYFSFFFGGAEWLVGS